MDNIAGTKSRLTWAVHISVALLVLAWLFPTVGLFVSSFRTADQITTSGWWASLFAVRAEPDLPLCAPSEQTQEGGLYVIEGNLFEDNGAEIGPSRSRPGACPRATSPPSARREVDMGDDGRITVAPNGDYRLVNAEEFSGHRRGERVFVTAETPPEFTLANYDRILFSGDSTDSMAKAFFNTLTVTIPATIIPIVVAAFAAYALAWMDFPGRALLIAIVVGLLVVPLQLALIPLLRLHLGIGIGKGYLGVWLAHTAFGMPLAVYLLRNYMVGCRATSSRTPRSTGRRISRSSPRSSCRSPSPRWPPSRSSSSCGPGTTCWWRACS
jgi:alpha-glucoside transport system permease protein